MSLQHNSIVPLYNIFFLTFLFFLYAMKRRNVTLMQRRNIAVGKKKINVKLDTNLKTLLRCPREEVSISVETLTNELNSPPTNLVIDLDFFLNYLTLDNMFFNAKLFIAWLSLTDYIIDERDSAQFYVDRLFFKVCENVNIQAINFFLSRELVQQSTIFEGITKILSFLCDLPRKNYEFEYEKQEITHCAETIILMHSYIIDQSIHPLIYSGYFISGYFNNIASLRRNYIFNPVF